MAKSTAARREPINQLDDAIQRGRRALLSEQKPDGSFEDHIDVGPIAVATQLVLERFLRVLSPDHAEAGVAALVRSQNSDGSFDPHPGADRGSVVTTALAVAAFESAGVMIGTPIERARRFVDHGGGAMVAVEAFFERGDVTALFLAAVGHVPSKFLPNLPLSVVVTPGMERMLDGRVHAGNLMALMTLLALGGKLRRRRSTFGGLTNMMLGAVRDVERRRAANYLGAWQNPDGSFNAALFPTQLMTLGYGALGLTAEDDRMARSLSWLDRQKSIVDGELVVQAIPNNVWSTAMAMLGMTASGDPNDEPCRRAAAFLMDAQHHHAQPRANQRRRGAERTGGWSFQTENPTMPDCDDAGLVLAALGTQTRETGTREVFHTMDRGVAWLRDMQNPDGGWAAYVWNLPGKAPGPMFLEDVPFPPLDDPRTAMSMVLNPPPELGDPSTEGVTARVLWGLGRCGIGRDDPMVCRAIEFLQEHQYDDGSFWDRWMTCYLPGTATVILGLDAVGEDLCAPYVRRAIHWMISKQNADGGFGETHHAFRNPRRAGHGPSMVAVTAFVVSALVAAKGPQKVIDDAVAFLLARQDDDGSWPDDGWLNPYVPPDTFYRYALPARCLPLLALGQVRG